MLREYYCESTGTVFWLHHEPLPNTGRTLRDLLLRTPGVQGVKANTLPTAGFFEVDYRAVRIVAIPDDPKILTLHQPANAEPSPRLREFAERLDAIVTSSDTYRYSPAMDTPIPGKPIDNWDVMQRAFNRWPRAASSPRRDSPDALTDDDAWVQRRISTLFDVASLDERLYLMVAGRRIHECTMQDLIGYRLDIEIHESLLTTYVFATDYTWFGVITAEDELFLFGNWEPVTQE